MNIVNKLTLRHLKENKRRTLVTIVGVIISVAMVTAVSTLGVSFIELLKRQTIAQEGEWHVFYHGVTKEQLKVIEKDENTKTVVISRDVGYSLLIGSQNVNKPYLFLKEYNTAGFNQFPIEVTEGRLPQSPNEVLISDEIATTAKIKYQIGDTLKLNVGERIGSVYSTETEKTIEILEQSTSLQKENGKVIETFNPKMEKTLKIVGKMKRPVWEPTWSAGYTIISYIDESMLEAFDRVNVSVVLKKVDSSLFSDAEKIARQHDISAVSFHNELLRLDGVTKNNRLRNMLFSLSAIIIGVIMIGSISLIYNAFAISVSERSRHLGMLSSVGATRRQKRNSVLFEGMVIGFISIPIGLFFGIVGIGITFYFINSSVQSVLGVNERLEVVITPVSILVPCTISFLTIFISTYSPAKKASKISAIDAIRQSTDIKLTRKKIKTSKLIRQLFGIEAEIGLKNLKRNKRRYNATIFSLVISIVLFLAVSFFTSSLKKSLELSQNQVNYDIQITLFENVELEKDERISTVLGLKDITESSVVKELNVTSWISQEYLPDQLKQMVKGNSNILVDGKMQYNVRISAMDDASLKSYVNLIEANEKELYSSKSLAGIVVDTINYLDEQTGKYVETKATLLKPGSILNLAYENWEQQKTVPLDNIKIAALTDQVPMGISPTYLGGLNVIVSEKVFNEILKDLDKPEVYSFLYLKSRDPMKTQQEIEELKMQNLSIYNVYQSRQAKEQMILLMSVFTYGFISLITAISIANIFNTISTSISLRKREFAMLKSVGMTPKGFNKMIQYESIFYGINSLLFGLPISLIVMYLIYRATMNNFDYSFSLPWVSISICLMAVFLIVSSAMLYSSRKVKKENIIDGLKQESL